MRIEYLYDNIEFAETTAKWCYDEFIFGIRDDLSYQDVLKETKICYKDKLPVRLIAIDEGDCTGMVSIVDNDLQCRDYTPWLAALYVKKECRSRGIGELLIESVKQITKDMGYSELYLKTEHTSGYYYRLGWEFVESCEDNFDLVPDVFKVSLF